MDTTEKNISKGFKFPQKRGKFYQSADGFNQADGGDAANAPRTEAPVTTPMPERVKDAPAPPAPTPPAYGRNALISFGIAAACIWALWKWA